MHELADTLRGILAQAGAQLAHMSEEEAGVPLKDEGWSPKQVVGHLIDSACNNHQRFVRFALSSGVDSPGYQQAEWVEVQQYAARPWLELLDLWSTYNRHLAHVIASVPARSLPNEG